MGKASKWFKALFNLNKKTTNPNLVLKPPKKCWLFLKHTSNNQALVTSHDDQLNKRVIAMAVASADVAEAAAYGAVEVLRLTISGGATPTNANYVAYVSRNRDCYGGREMLAAVKIQSHFRAYLSRRALRALKSLVKLQALVRGRIVRRQTADNIRRVHVLLRVQARALATRSHTSSRGSSAGPNPRFRELIELKSLDHLNLLQNPEYSVYYTTLTPTASDFSRSGQSSFSEHPSYMSETESSKAKMRSLSAPKQRPQYERSSSSSSSARGREYSNQNSNDFRFNHQKILEVRAKFANKLYPGSGRLGNVGVATRGDNHLDKV